MLNASSQGRTLHTYRCTSVYTSFPRILQPHPWACISFQGLVIGLNPLNGPGPSLLRKQQGLKNDFFLPLGPPRLALKSNLHTAQ